MIPSCHLIRHKRITHVFNNNKHTLLKSSRIKMFLTRHAINCSLVYIYNKNIQRLVDGNLYKCKYTAMGLSHPCCRELKAKMNSAEKIEKRS